jgi:hypothetical protein
MFLLGCSLFCLIANRRSSCLAAVASATSLEHHPSVLGDSVCKNYISSLSTRFLFVSLTFQLTLVICSYNSWEAWKQEEERRRRESEEIARLPSLVEQPPAPPPMSPTPAGQR